MFTYVVEYRMKRGPFYGQTGKKKLQARSRIEAQQIFERDFPEADCCNVALEAA